MLSQQVTPSRSLFQGKEGHPLKFRLQPGFSNLIKTQLEKAIVTHGGSILSKVPIYGIVVIDPKSRDGRELLLEWSWPERPYRFFVSYTYVLACVDAGRLLPLRESALKRDMLSFGSSALNSNLKNLPAEVKEKLATYLASAVPDSTVGNRSSNALYFKLTENPTQYPWIEGYDWKELRTDYCRNKETYDKKIAELLSIDTNNRKFTKPFPASSTPLRLSVTQSHGSRMRSAFRLTKTLLITRPRKFAANEANLDERRAGGHRQKSAYKVPNARKLGASKKPRLEAEVPSPDYEEVEVGRHAIVSEVGFEDDTFRGRKLPFAAPSKKVDDYTFDGDAFNSNILFGGPDEESSLVDEHTVEEVLGLSTVIEHDAPGDDGMSLFMGSNDLPSSSFAKDLASGLRFTQGEVEEKLAAFFGDPARTRTFFLRCRALVDDLFCAQMNEAVTSSSGRMSVRAFLSNY